MYDDSGREELKDKKFTQDVENESIPNKYYHRLVAKQKTFKNINFKFCIFDNAYLRKCVFENCDFTGCKFVNSNLVGSSFEGCKFDYATFDKTLIENVVLNSSCPDRDNLKLKFARSLRLNYQQLGDATSANKAMNVELAATRRHHWNAWCANDQYHRSKYKGVGRLKAFWDWLVFVSLDAIWGNGESLLKLIRAAFVVLLIITIFEVCQSPDANKISSYWEGLITSPQIFLGVIDPVYISDAGQTAIYFVRLVMFAFFMSITIKRFNRR
ncbi:pentapeptide repeat-containing protein [Magnetovibrio sp. PR-2]|uniref:pentapeptide repeat-containing protein n=1 Tax=Magnetovibrio sp. PR-2 TaxID=3120356 RepID=UPI002FCDF6B4